MNFAEKLQAMRKTRGMSQENLADAVSVSRQAVSKWESGASYPEMGKLIAISDLFGVSLDYLVKDTYEDGKDENGSRYGRYSGLPFMFHYEYKSRRTLFNLPLVHINVGRGLYKAKGIIAVGNIAVGGLSVGIISLGVLSVGALALGLLSFAGLALGLLFAAGGVAVGTAAAGGLALGIFAMGGLAVGMFSFGGCAVASNIAVGGYASGHVAIGETVRGFRTIVIKNHAIGSVKAEQARALISGVYPHLWKPILEWITMFFS